MSTRILFLFPIMMFCWIFSSVQAFAFFGDERIELVQDGTFTKDSNVRIEKALEDYNLCTRGDWRSTPTNDGKKVVTYRCQYNTPTAIKTMLSTQQVLDPQVQEAVLKNLEEQEFALDFLLTFTIDDAVKHFSLAQMAFVFKGTEQAMPAQVVPVQLQHILQNKPLVLPLEGKGAHFFAYTVHKYLLGEQESYQKVQKHQGMLPDSFQGKGSVALVSKLGDVQFDDATQAITGTLVMSLVATPEKDTQEESGYFLKYFKAALGPQPVVLYTESLPVQLVPQMQALPAIHFASPNKKAQVFFEKKTPLAPVDMRIEYVHASPKTAGQVTTQAAEQGAGQEAGVVVIKDPIVTPQTPTASPATPSVVTGESKKDVVPAPKENIAVTNIVGNYGYNAQGMEGSARITPQENDTQSVQVTIKTVNVQALHLCEYEGLCTYKDNVFLCAMEGTPEGMDSTFTLIPADDAFSVPTNPVFLCGARGFMHGEYSRCEEDSSGPLVMTVIPVEIIQEDDTYIARFTDDGSESLDFISKAQAEFLETMIGKKVLVHYNKNQIWDEQKNFCKRTKEIISVVDASLPEVQLYGGYSIYNDAVRGYAYIEPNFETDAVFNVHLNNYSPDLKENCQFAGACYTEGKGFLCKSFDQDQKEFFEILPTENGFTVPKNDTNICEYKDFMSGKYKKCESIAYGIFSISGTLLSVDQENFAESTMIIDSYGNKILVSLTKEQVAQAQSFVGKKIFVSYEDKQFWSVHDRACVREKQMLAINDISLIQENLMGKYQHQAQGVQGSAILAPAPKESLEEFAPFSIELYNKGLMSQEECSFSGICTPGGMGFMCKGQGEGKKDKEFLTLIPQAEGFDITLSLSTSCAMKGIRAGNYTKCTEQTLNAGTVSGTLIAVEEDTKGNIHFVVQINDKKMPFNMTHGRLDLVQKLIGKKVLVHYKDEQKWDEQANVCTKIRNFTSIKEVK